MQRARTLCKQAASTARISDGGQARTAQLYAAGLQGIGQLPGGAHARPGQGSSQAPRNTNRTIISFTMADRGSSPRQPAGPPLPLTPYTPAAMYRHRLARVGTAHIRYGYGTHRVPTAPRLYDPQGPSQGHVRQAPVRQKHAHVRQYMVTSVTLHTASHTPKTRLGTKRAVPQGLHRKESLTQESANKRLPISHQCHHHSPSVVGSCVVVARASPGLAAAGEPVGAWPGRRWPACGAAGTGAGSGGVNRVCRLLWARSTRCNCSCACLRTPPPPNGAADRNPCCHAQVWSPPHYGPLHVQAPVMARTQLRPLVCKQLQLLLDWG